MFNATAARMIASCCYSLRMQGDRSVKKGMAAAVVIGTLFGMMGCSAPETLVIRDQYGADWPWPKFDRGVISCYRNEVTIKLGNMTYALNGLAQGQYPIPGS